MELSMANKGPGTGGVGKPDPMLCLATGMSL